MAYHTETYYVWKEFDMRLNILVTPLSESKYSIDFTFKTPEEAIEYAKECHDFEEYKTWILCEQTITMNMGWNSILEDFVPFPDNT